MLKRLQISLVLLAWFMATGAQWDLVQTIGWGQMIVSHAHEMTLLAAVEKTFDGEMCKVCKAVSEAKQHENQSTVPRGTSDGKIILVFEAATSVILSVPHSEVWSPSNREPTSAQRSAPPSPPPRV